MATRIKLRNPRIINSGRNQRKKNANVPACETSQISENGSQEI